jgi:hypothetical protein
MLIDALAYAAIATAGGVGSFFPIADWQGRDATNDTVSNLPTGWLFHLVPAML